MPQFARHFLISRCYAKRDLRRIFPVTCSNRRLLWYITKRPSVKAEANKRPNNCVSLHSSLLGLGVLQPRHNGGAIRLQRVTIGERCHHIICHETRLNEITKKSTREYGGAYLYVFRFSAY